MIIDGDTHISSTGEDAMAITCEELVRRMDRAGVDKALTWLRPPYSRDIDPLNRYVFQATQRYPDRILGFGWADPRLGLAKAKDAVKRCLQDYGFFGVKLNGAQNSFFIDDPAISLPLVEDISKSGKLVAFHTGTDAYEATHPFRVAKVARLFPELRILMVHMGGVAHHDLSDAAIEAALECANLTLIGSSVRSRAILKAIKTLGAGRVCFGSDTPFEPMHVEVARYRALLSGEVTPQESELVMGGNIARLLGIGPLAGPEG